MSSTVSETDAGQTRSGPLAKSTSEPIPYLPIEQHGVIGDRRSAALVASDGTIDWLCLPHYGGDVVLGAMLDHEAGGFWRLGPAARLTGKQHYRDDTATLLTNWNTPDFALELADTMAPPYQSGQPADERFLVRQLRCTRGRAACALSLRLCNNFAPIALELSAPDQASAQTIKWHVGLWTSSPLPNGRSRERSAEGTTGGFELTDGEEFWAVLALDGSLADMSPPRAAGLVRQADNYWRHWLSGLQDTGQRANIRRSAITIHLLSYGPAGSVVAAPTTSLPERIGGDWNADYRLSWVRDSSLALGVLARLGKTRDGGRFLDWLAHRDSSTPAPLQVVYGVEGETRLTPHERTDLSGYRHSQPVRFGNHAYKQHQHDSLGYLADCILLHLEHGGDWRAEYWDLVRRLADFVSAKWKQPGNSIWELPVVQHYLSGKVMSWVALDRALEIAHKVGGAGNFDTWRTVRNEIHQDILKNGWSARLGAFRQRYEGENLDAAALLISVMGVLPPDDPRVTSTIDQIADRLTVNGFVYRFDPRETPGMGSEPMGAFEGAFFPCTFWLSTAYAKAGDSSKAEEILQQAEDTAGPLGLFAEGVDARSKTFLGNTPLVFSHTEYIRAAFEISQRDSPS